jgi:hypothetical protein
MKMAMRTAFRRIEVLGHLQRVTLFAAKRDGTVACNMSEIHGTAH